MVFSINAALLDALVLAIVERGDTYGYEITQAIRQSVNMSESTLYPVLRRLQRNNFLETYDREFSGRNRRYYKITASGKEKLSDYIREWRIYKTRIEYVLTGEDIQ